MSEVVERVAKAIENALDDWMDEHDRLHLDIARDEIPYDVLARAAIAAMREPTEAMLNEATAFGHMMSNKDMKEYWGAMIDASLSG